MPRPTRWPRVLRARRPAGSRTRRLLELHLAVIVLAALVSMTALLVSYREVQNAAGEMRAHAAPAVQGVAATQLALLRAHKEAKASVNSGIDEVVGAGRATRPSSPQPARACPGSPTSRSTANAAGASCRPSPAC